MLRLCVVNLFWIMASTWTWWKAIFGLVMFIFLFFFLFTGVLPENIVWPFCNRVMECVMCIPKVACFWICDIVIVKECRAQRRVNTAEIPAFHWSETISTSYGYENTARYFIHFYYLYQCRSTSFGAIFRRQMKIALADPVIHGQAMKMKWMRAERKKSNIKR